MANRIPIILFIAGLFLIAVSIISGTAKAGIFIIFPFIYGSGIVLLFGVILIFISMFMFAFSFPEEYEGEEYEGYEIKERKGGLILIGPIPIIITDDNKIALIFVAIAIALIFLFIIFLFIKI